MGASQGLSGASQDVLGASRERPGSVPRVSKAALGAFWARPWEPLIRQDRAKSDFKRILLDFGLSWTAPGRPRSVLGAILACFACAGIARSWQCVFVRSLVYLFVRSLVRLFTGATKQVDATADLHESAQVAAVCCFVLCWFVRLLVRWFAYTLSAHCARATKRKTKRAGFALRPSFCCSSLPARLPRFTPQLAS